MPLPLEADNGFLELIFQFEYGEYREWLQALTLFAAAQPVAEI